MSTCYPELKLCQYGRVVTFYDTKNQRDIVGHIVGFGRGSKQQLKIRVQWEDESIGLVDPKHVEFIGE